MARVEPFLVATMWCQFVSAMAPADEWAMSATAGEVRYGTPDRNSSVHAVSPWLKISSATSKDRSLTLIHASRLKTSPTSKTALAAMLTNSDEAGTNAT